MKTLFIFIFLTISSGLQKTYGQAAILALIFGDKVASEDFNLSLEFGWNYSEVSNFTDTEKTNATNFGLGCNFKLSNRVYFSPSIFFLSKRKFNFSGHSLNTGNQSIDNEFVNTTGSANLSYIDIPALFWLERNKIRFGFGPQISFLINSELIFNGNDGDFTQNIQSNTNNIDYGLMACVGYELGKARKGKGIFIQGRYYYGMADIYNSEVIPEANKLSYFAIHLSLPFITDELAKRNLDKY